MTPARWAETPFPLPLIRYLADDRRLDARRARLFACACARLVWHDLKDPAAQDAVESAWSFGDGRESAWGLGIVARFARDRCDETPDDRGLELAYLTTEPTINVLTVATVTSEILQTQTPRGDDTRAASNRALADLVRDVFPYADVTIDPAWRTAAVVDLVNGMHATHDFTAMPVLADLLEEAGCVDVAILGHARNPDIRHSRGCWLVDAVRKPSSRETA
jgi:hypothetical protein